MTRRARAGAGDRARIALTRVPLVLALALVLTGVALRSSLARMLPFPLAAFPALAWLFLGIVVAFVPALLARDTPLPAAAAITVPILAAGSYGASRLDWLRVLKDFGVSETSVIDAIRLLLAALALTLLWALHAADLATRMRARAVERGIDAGQAGEAAARTLRRNAEAAGIAMAGSAGLLVVGLGGVALGNALPTERAALVAPLLAAGILVAAGIYLARSAGAKQD